MPNMIKPTRKRVEKIPPKPIAGFTLKKSKPRIKAMTANNASVNKKGIAISVPNEAQKIPMPKDTR